MSDLATRIRQVHQHVEGLRKDRDRLTRANASQEEDLRDTKRNVDVLQARITELERENEVLRTVKAAITERSGSAGDRSGSKERIDELVNEIDRCLALLNN